MATSRRESGRHRSRTRSKSPEASSTHLRRRSPIPSRTQSSSHRHRHYGQEHRHSPDSRQPRKHTKDAVPPRFQILPFKAKLLSKNDLPEFRAMFASYLDIQKQLYVEELSEDEVKGRWKSFVGKWYVVISRTLLNQHLLGMPHERGCVQLYLGQSNDTDYSRNRGELAEGWYDPATRDKANEAITYDYDDDNGGGKEDETAESGPRQKDPMQRDTSQSAERGLDDNDDDDDDDSEDDNIGPALPSTTSTSVVKRAGHGSGPSAPNMQELTLRDEAKAEEALAQREDARFARKVDRKEQRERLDELVPRAEPGSKERRQEKRRENAAASKSFRDAKGAAGDMQDVAESELLGGGGGGGIEEARRMRREAERKKNERELRREEILRARAVEREEKLRVHKEKEDQTMEMLKAIAKERFG